MKGFEEKVQEALERERDVKVAYAAGRGSGIEGEDALTMQAPSEAEKEVQETIVHPSERAKGPDSGVDSAVATDLGKEVAASFETEKQSDQEIDRGSSTPNRRTLDYTRLKAVIMDLFSDRQVSVRKWDLTTWVLEGAASGIIVVGLIAAVLLRPK